MINLLLLGAGYVGTRYAAALLQQGLVPQRLTLTACTAHESTAQALAARLRGQVPVFHWNLGSQEPLPPTLISARAAPLTHVVYLAPPPSTPAAARNDPVLQGALPVLCAMPLRRFVYVSTTGVYGDAGGERVDEDSAVQPSNARGARRVAAGAARGIAWTVLRVPGIYGPGRLPLERLRRGEPLPEQSLGRPGNRIQVDDLLAALHLAAFHPAGANRCYNVGDGDPTGTAVFLQRLAQLVGLPPPPVLPEAMASLQLSAESRSFLSDSRQVDTHRLRAELGFQPRYTDCTAGLRASLAEAAGNGTFMALPLLPAGAL
jgi:nucleoside-diphosphate-sugar epimerase